MKRNGKEKGGKGKEENEQKDIFYPQAFENIEHPSFN
jgi:hypothetical protein